MGTGDLPDHDELREVVGYLRAGLDGRWTVRDWSAWSGRSFAWCYTATRGLLRAMGRVRELEAETALLRAELDALRRQSAPVAPAVVPRTARPPPPPVPESRAVSGLAGRPPTDLEAEVLRRVESRLRDVVAEEWREVSQVQLEEEVWARDGDTVFEDPHGG